MPKRIKEPEVFIIIPTHANRRSDVVANIKSIQKGSYKNYRILVIDQASTDDTYSYLLKYFKTLSVIHNPKNLGATGGKNQGIKHAPPTADYLLFLDSDFILDKKAISELVKAIDKNPQFGAATAKVLFHTNPQKVQYAGSRVGLYTSINYSNSGQDNGQFDKMQITEGAGGAFLVKKKVAEKVGFFDEAYFPVYYEDADYSYRLNKLGYKILYVPSSRFYHKAPSQDTNVWLNSAYLTARNKLIFMRKHSKNFLLFLLIYPIFPAFYLYTSLRYKRFDALKNYIRGIIDGLLFSISYK